MKNQNNLEEEIKKKFLPRDKKKVRKMKISGKSVFNLKRIIQKKIKINN